MKETVADRTKVPTCARCGNLPKDRVRRQGLIHTLTQRLGFYPWECSGCRAVRLHRLRAKAKAQRQATPGN